MTRHDQTPRVTPETKRAAFADYDAGMSVKDILHTHSLHARQFRELLRRAKRLVSPSRLAELLPPTQHEVRQPSP